MKSVTSNMATKIANGGALIWLLEIVTSSGTLYYADQPVVVGGQRYSPCVFNWGSGVDSSIVSGDNAIRLGQISGVEITPAVAEWDYIQEDDVVNLSFWYRGLEGVDKKAYNQYYIAKKTPGTFNIILDLTDIGDKKNKLVGELATLNSYPELISEHVNKMFPTPIGTNKNNPHNICVKGPWETTLSSDYVQGTTTFTILPLANGRTIPSNGTLVIGDYNVAYTLSGTTMTVGATAIPSGYPKGTKIMQYRNDLEFHFAHVPIKSLTNPRILPDGKAIEDAVAIDAGVITLNPNNSGKATAVITDALAIRNRVNLAVGKTESGHTHTAPGGTEYQENRRANSYSNQVIPPGGAISNPANAYDGAIGDATTYAQITSPFANGVTSLRYGFSQTNLGTLIKAIAVVRTSGNYIGGYGGYATISVGGMAAQNIPQAAGVYNFNFAVTSWAQLYADIASVTNSHPFLLKLYDIYLEVHYTTSGTTSSSTSNISVSMSGSPISEMLGGSLIVDSEGIKDTTAHYTGDSAAMIQKPTQLFHYLAENEGNGIVHANIDLAGSFADTLDALPSYYAFNFVISEQIWLNDLLTKLAMVINCWYLWENGVIKLILLKNFLTSQRTVDSDVDCPAPCDWKKDPHIDQNNFKVINRTIVPYNLDYTKGDGSSLEHYAKTAKKEELDASASVVRYGRQEYAFVEFGKFIGDNINMANDIAQVQLDNRYVPKDIFSGTFFQSQLDVERGDRLKIVAPDLDLALDTINNMWVVEEIDAELPPGTGLSIIARRNVSR